MFDQSFSPSNFETIFNIEHRKGRIDYNRMPQDYKDAVSNIQWIKGEMAKQRKKKRNLWTPDEAKDYENNKGLLKVYQEEKEQALKAELEELSNQANDHSFRFVLHNFIEEKKEYFFINPADKVQYFAEKCMQRNIVKVFKVEMVNRHTTMASLKHLLNNNLPVYIIRTDVKSFYESIDQNRLFELISRNTLLSKKTTEMIAHIFHNYEQVKDKNKVPYGKGVPRGIGISAPLSEIYMADIDKSIKGRKEVIFYTRYVDDIFIIMSNLGKCSNLHDYYQDIVNNFANYGLTLQPEGSEKCKLIDLYSHVSTGVRQVNVGYLGYTLYITKEPNSKKQTIFGLSDKRKQRFKGRVDHIFERFAHVVKVNTRHARRDLKDGLNLVTGNIRLIKAKSGVKVGFFYNNDLLDKDSDFDELEQYIKGKILQIPANLFANPVDRMAYEANLRTFISSISLKDRWEERKTFDFTNERLREVERWL